MLAPNLARVTRNAGPARVDDHRVGYAFVMKKQMEGDNKTRRKAAREAREAGSSAGEQGVSSGASKQRHHVSGSAGSDERLESIQRGEAKEAGADVPRPLRGKGRSRDAA